MLLIELMEMSDQSFSTVKMVFKSNFKRRGLNISFPTHADKRATEPGRGDDVDDQRVMEALTKMLRLYDNKDPRFMGMLEVVKRGRRGVEAVFKYFYDDTAVNIPCAVEIDPIQKGGIKLVMKTIMTKPDFKPHSSHDIVFVL